MASARIIKTLGREIDKKLDGKGRPHREHRSKKGRGYHPDRWRILLLKRKKAKLKELEEKGKSNNHMGKIY